MKASRGLEDGFRDRGAARVGILGAGFISDHHLWALQSVPGVRVTAVCDTDGPRALKVQKRWGVPRVFESLPALLNSGQVDVVHILLPPPLHTSSALACMEAGCDVFLEKPVATSVAECEDLKRTSALLGRIAGINHNARFHPALLRLVEMIRKCRLGAVQHVIACLNVPLRQLAAGQHSHWMFQTPGNIVLEQAPHPLSQIQLLLGDVQDVSSMPSGRITLNSGVPFYDNWQISMRCLRGTAQCFLSFGKGFWDSWLYAIGEDGAAFVDLRRNTLRFAEKTRFLEPADHLWNVFRGAGASAQDGLRNFTDYVLAFLRLAPQKDPFYTTIGNSISAFYRARANGLPVPVTLEQGCEIIRACELISASVDLPYPHSQGQGVAHAHLG